MTCDIIMVTWNEPAMTERALESIKANSGYPYRLIVIDNRSDSETVGLLKEASRSGRFGEMLLVCNEDNIGWDKAVNQGLALSSADYVCLVNNDILAGPGWLRNRVSVMDGMADVGIADPEGDQHHRKREVTDVDAYARRLSERNRGQFTEVESCSGFCMLIKRGVIDTVGKLDETYEGGGYGSDGDYCQRAWQAGYRCIRCHDAFVLHLGSRSYRKIPELWKRYLEGNRVAYEKRWGKKRRILVLANYPAGEDLLRMARTGHIVYVIRNRFVNPHTLPSSHINLRFRGIRAPLIGGTLQFLVKALHLRYRGRIDAAMIAYNRAGLGGVGARNEPAESEDRRDRGRAA